MLVIEILGLDQFVAGHYSREHGKNLANLFEIDEKELVFYSPVSALFHDGVEQVSWNCLVIVKADRKYSALEEKVAGYILSTLTDFSVNVTVRFEYWDGREYSHINPDYPRYLTSENIRRAEERYDEEVAEASSHVHVDGEEEIFVGNAFEGHEEELEALDEAIAERLKKG